MRAAVLVCLLCLAPAPALAQSGGAGAAGGPGYTATEPLRPGETLTDIAVVFRPEGAAPRGLERDVRAAIGLRPGDAWDPALAGAARAAVRALPGVRRADFGMLRAAGGAIRRLTVTVGLDAGAAEPPRGLVLSGDPADFPALYRSDDALLAVELNGGMGVFSDGNPWFGHPEVFTRGNPLVEDPAEDAGSGDRATWAEGFVQFGLGGVGPLGPSGLYAFGSASWIAPGSVGRDIFRDDARASFDVEKLHGGLLYAPGDRDLRLKVSAGRQSFTLHDGVLVSQFGSQWNAGPRPGVYLAPRTAHDMAVIASARADSWSAQGFSLDPNEYEPIESDTRLLGHDIGRRVGARLSVNVTALHVPSSDTAYRAPDGLPRGREGLWTAAGRIAWRAPADGPGLWAKAELARQWHGDFPIAARAGYARLGWIARDLPWSPSLSYRLAHFSGDDPATRRYERFDSLYSGGLDQWLQGISINKLLSQPNRTSHRLRLDVAPSPRLDLALEWDLHRADALNSLGEKPGPRHARRVLGDHAPALRSRDRRDRAAGRGDPRRDPGPRQTLDDAAGAALLDLLTPFRRPSDDRDRDRPRDAALRGGDPQGRALRPAPARARPRAGADSATGRGRGAHRPRRSFPTAPPLMPGRGRFCSRGAVRAVGRIAGRSAAITSATTGAPTGRARTTTTTITASGGATRRRPRSSVA